MREAVVATVVTVLYQMEAVARALRATFKGSLAIDKGPADAVGRYALDQAEGDFKPTLDVARQPLPTTKLPPSTILQRSRHHDLQAAAAADEYRALGYTISDLKQVTFGGSCLADGRCRTDFGGFDLNGKAVVFEVKTGDADLSIRQSDIYPQIQDGNAIPHRRVAAALGLVPGWPLKDQGYPNGIPVIEVRKPGLGR